MQGDINFSLKKQQEKFINKTEFFVKRLPAITFLIRLILFSDCFSKNYFSQATFF